MTSSGGLNGINLGAFQEKYVKLQQDLRDLQTNIEQISETATSEDRLVSATVGPRGELKGIELDPRIYRSTDAKKLAETITQAIWDATEQVTDRLVELTSPLIPDTAPVDFDLRGELRRVPSDAGER